jgi:hypothetical protein
MNDLFAHNFYPNVPGFKKAGTSSRAAEEMRERAPTIKQRILASMEKGHAWTPDKFAEAHGIDILSVRPRFSELLKQGKIVETRHTARNSSGKLASICCSPRFLAHHNGQIAA